jgi:hypothetical protein
MAHFALVENNIVKNVIVVSDSDCGDVPFPNSEQIGKDYISSLGIDGVWIQTSVEKEFRSNYAFIGGTYDPELDAFIEIKPYDSWVLNPSNQWTAPVPYPSDGDVYEWDEEGKMWKWVDHLEWLNS